MGSRYPGSQNTQPKNKDDDSQRIIPFALHDANASDVRDLIRGASKCGDVRRNSCAVQLKQKLMRHRSRRPVLFLREIRTRSDVFRSNRRTVHTAIRDQCRPRWRRRPGPPRAVCATLQGVKCNASCETGANFRRQIPAQAAAQTRTVSKARIRLDSPGNLFERDPSSGPPSSGSAGRPSSFGCRG